MSLLRVLLVNWPREEALLIKRLSVLGVDVSLLYIDPARFNISLLRKKDFDVVYISRVGPEIFRDLSMLIKLLDNVPLVYGVLEPSLITRPFRPLNYLYNVKSMLKLLMLKLMNIKGYHVLNSFEYHLYRYLFPRAKVYYIPYSIDIEAIESCKKEKEQDFSVLFVYAEYRKGADIAFHTARFMLRKLSDFKFYAILGRGYLKKPFYSLEREFPGRVAVYDYMPRRKLYTLLSRVHILLFPSRWEVFGRIALEALALGTPVVCFDIPGVPHDIIRRKGVGYVAKPFSLHDLVRGVWRMYEIWKKKPDQYFRLSTFAISVAKKYSYERIAQLFKTMFLEVSKVSKTN